MVKSAMKMSRLIMCTVGFDEKLVLRSLLRIGFGIGDRIVLVYSKSGSEYDVRRVENAVNAIKNLLSSTGVAFHDVVVSGMDFVSDVVAIVKALMDYATNAAEIVAAVAGGMRLTVVETIVALQLYKILLKGNADAKIYVAREDGLYDVFVPISILNPPSLQQKDLEVLKAVGDGMKLSDAVEAISTRLEVTKYASYRLIRRLKKLGLVWLENHTIRLTLLGKIAKEVVQ